MCSTAASEYGSEWLDSPRPSSRECYAQAYHSPPYEVDDTPDPLQMYGRQKLAGEKAVLGSREKGANATAVRVPVL